MVIDALRGVLKPAATISVTFAGPTPEDAPPRVIQAGSPETVHEQKDAACTPMLNDPPAPVASMEEVVRAKLQGGFNTRTRLFPESATKILPSPSVEMPSGWFTAAAAAGPLSPL